MSSNPVEAIILGFSSIIWEALPFIVLGVVIAGVLEEFMPPELISKFVPRRRLIAIVIGGFLGAIFPMCECGILVVMKRLLRKGLPLSVCVCYMLAGPIINVVVIFSTFKAFQKNPIFAGDKASQATSLFGGAEYIVLLRLGLALLVAVVTSLVVDWMYGDSAADQLHPSVMKGAEVASAGDETKPRPRKSWFEHLNGITETALHDFVDIMAFLILGAFLAVAGRQWLVGTSANTHLTQQPQLAILLMMGIAIVLCICSEADAFIAAAFPATWTPASKLAFLVLGPMLDFKLILMYTRVFRPKLMITIIGTVVIQVFVYAMIVHLLTT